jgi:hypothetical protein
MFVVDITDFGVCKPSVNSNMYVCLVAAGRFCQFAIRCMFSTVSTDFTCCTELVCYISLALSALRWPVDFSEHEIRGLDAENARNSKETILGIQQEHENTVLATGMQQDCLDQWLFLSALFSVSVSC